MGFFRSLGLAKDVSKTVAFIVVQFENMGVCEMLEHGKRRIRIVFGCRLAVVHHGVAEGDEAELLCFGEIF